MLNKDCRNVKQLNPYVLIEKPKMELPHFLVKCKIGATRNKYGELKQIQFGSTNCTCQHRRKKKRNTCFEHIEFDTGFYNGNIEERSYFKTLVKDLDTFNKLDLYISACWYHAFCICEDSFYQNVQRLVEACREEHSNMSKRNTAMLIKWFYYATHQ